ncbi:pantoate--beta-alanine ligase [Membranicola marinus]|uniref:Pantothenate synthetase n=1 Tax=Membranihabitans marinus TaxID=1227546 RepID=A0A953HVB9_9BACT|nr:pantoate--beta-alanine ligase [Membranihabitans marinus]MBY5958518.1 pantoate--beta-alanine ligase [Membranihabitans marinus]
MFLYKTVTALQNHLQERRKEGKAIGFVPTLGALHRGHGSLIKASLNKQCYTVVSIYVNPTQFNDVDDLAKYPRPLVRDLQFLFDLGCDVLFLPTDGEVYPDGRKAGPDLDLRHLGTTLEAAFRPGHFEGVLQVVDRLLNIVQPDILFMGEKDLQQLLVIRKLIESKKLSIELEAVPTVREENGLALSSRNERLTAEHRAAASLIYTTLSWVAENFKSDKLEDLKSEAIAHLNQSPFRPEYFEFVRGDNLQILSQKDEYQGVIYAVTAVWCTDIRLIDNMAMPD